LKQPTVYILKDEQIQLSIKNTSHDTQPLLSCRLKKIINGEVSLTFTIPSDHPDRQHVRTVCCAEVKDPDGFFRAFVIVEETEIHNSDGIVREFWCEDLAVSELNDEIVTDVRPQNTSVTSALQSILTNAVSRWQVGTVSNLGTE